MLRTREVWIAKDDKQDHLQELRELQMREAGKEFAKVQAMEVSLSSLDSVRKFCAAYNKRKEPLHFLILNAGVMGADSVRRTTEDGFEQHFQASNMLQSSTRCCSIRTDPDSSQTSREKNAVCPC